jgi:hypothetical protein
MSLPLIIVIGVAVLCIFVALNRESFVPEFLEQSNVRRTAELSTSHYSQETNHVRPDGRFDAPLHGSESPFRVNMVNAYL